MWRDVKGCKPWLCSILPLCDNNIKQNQQHLHHEISHRLPSHPWHPITRQEISMGQISITNQTTKFVWGSAYKLPLNTSYSLIHMPLIIISYHHFRWSMWGRYSYCSNGSSQAANVNAALAGWEELCEAQRMRRKTCWASDVNEKVPLSPHQDPSGYRFSKMADKDVTSPDDLPIWYTIWLFNIAIENDHL